jgi:hypothetical protein
MHGSLVYRVSADAVQLGHRGSAARAVEATRHDAFQLAAASLQLGGLRSYDAPRDSATRPSTLERRKRKEEVSPRKRSAKPTGRLDQSIRKCDGLGTIHHLLTTRNHLCRSYVFLYSTRFVRLKHCGHGLGIGLVIAELNIAWIHVPFACVSAPLGTYSSFQILLSCRPAMSIPCLLT